MCRWLWPILRFAEHFCEIYFLSMPWSSTLPYALVKFLCVLCMWRWMCKMLVLSVSIGERMPVSPSDISLRARDVAQWSLRYFLRLVSPELDRLLSPRAISNFIMLLCSTPAPRIIELRSPSLVLCGVRNLSHSFLFIFSLLPELEAASPKM